MNSTYLLRGVFQVIYGFLKAYEWLFCAGILISGGVFFVAFFYQDRYLFALGCAFLRHLVCGIVLGFLVHEIAHVVFICLTMNELMRIELEFNLFRFSVRGIGSSTGRGIFATALSGPIVAVVFGFILSIVFPDSGLLGWYVLHLLFLLPIFGDGRALVFGVRNWGRQVRVNQ
ncbi:hypothetical protein [Arcanobacterium phocae]|uniref:hypothetical protein n=1 Tax=Arcanobacterium phocae TaxID=131112 RepID=UPI001C0EF1F1|nr:hypothetical protein [Arcanobacterium phocae]